MPIVYILHVHFRVSCQCLQDKVHEDDLVGHYDMLKAYLVMFSGDRLPSAQDHQAWDLALG